MMSTSVTTAAIITFSEELEDNSSAFYEEMADRWPDIGDLLLTFAVDGKKNKAQVVRTYQETISDALEASYSFEGLDLGNFSVNTTLSEGIGLAGALEQAIVLEKTACAFYLDVAQRSESLLATIPRAFKRVVKNRSKRQEKLDTMLQAASSA